MPETATTCALEGCDRPVVRRPGGGRPRLYCSDGHRAEARRRRLTASMPADADDPVGLARQLLREALGRLEQAAAGTDARDGARLAQLRAQATAQVLEAQQLAADAARRAESLWVQLESERAEWASVRRVLAEERDRASGALQELTGALEGARAELEHELVRHHEDVEELTRRLHTQGAAHAAAMSEVEALGRTIAETRASLELAERRATQAENAARRGDDARHELEVRAARADEQAKQAAARVRQLEADLRQARRDLVAERRQRGAIVTELRRQLGAGKPRAPRPAPRKAAATS